MAKGQEVEERPDADLRDRLHEMEAKVRKMRDVRNNFNDAAKRFAEQRNAVQTHYKEHRTALDEKLEERKAVRELINQHKERRNAMQAQLRDLYAQQSGNRSNSKKEGSVVGEYNKILSEVSMLEKRFETGGTLTPSKEKNMIKAIKELKRRQAELEPSIKKFEMVKIDLSNIDEAIATLKAEADISHQAMIEQVKISDEMSEVLNGMFEQRDFLKAEGDRLHNGFLEEREKADEIHGKMSELMDQVTEARNELKAQNEERKSWLTDHNTAVTDELKSGADDEDVANELVSELLSSGSLSVGGTTSTDSLGGERTRRTKSKKKARVSSFAAARGNRGRSVKKD